MPEVQMSELEEAMSALLKGADCVSSTLMLSYVPPKASPCANTITITGGGKANCNNDANQSCGKCELVRDSWQPAWARECRNPTFIGNDGPPIQTFGHLNYLWGNMPAIDVLNIEKNEEETYGKDFDLLFAATGDPRNLMSTINGLPNTYEGKTTCVLNDKNLNVVARNVVMLLIAAQSPPVEAAETILHVWYSARLTKGMLAAINKYARELIEDLNLKIKDKSDKVLQSKRWPFGSVEVTVRLTKPQWKTVLSIIDAKHDLSKTEEERRKVVLAPHRLDYRERELHTLSGFSRLGSMRFRETGVLAPLASVLGHFDYPNPLLFNENDSTWLQKDSADPRGGWPMQSTLSKLHSARNAKNDVNGLLYFHIRSVIEQFCNRLQNSVSKIKIMLYCVDAASLPGCFGPEIRATGFDRIEVSNITDENYLGLFKTLKTFAFLLKGRSANPQAALITLFLNACEIADRQMGYSSDSMVQKSRLKQVLEYLHIDPRKKGEKKIPDVMTMMAANDLVRDYDRIFGFYMDVVRFEACSKQTGVKMRQRNTIVEAWPRRLKKKPGEKGADEEFQSLLASDSSGAERYVEWVREV
ncbi:MAG: hypothetical protein Q9226_008703 [Calogaya cf. arnoldii]